jgi:hypothetical protein
MMNDESRSAPEDRRAHVTRIRLATCAILLLLLADSARAAAQAPERPSPPASEQDLLLAPPAGAPNRARRVLFELRLAESQPVRGLTIEGTVKGTGKKIYPHYNTVLANADVLHAGVVSTAGRHDIEIVFTREGIARLAAAAVKHQGRPLAIILDGDIAADFTVRTLSTDRIVFDAGFSEGEANRIAAGLNNW